MSTCAWCNQESGRKSPTGTSHGICAYHKKQVLAEIRGEIPDRMVWGTRELKDRTACMIIDEDVSNIARTFKDNERSREYARIPVVCNDDLDAYIKKTPGRALRDVAIGFVAGALLLTLAILAFHAL